jgi:hypothetical protein
MIRQTVGTYHILPSPSVISELMSAMGPGFTSY